MNARKVSSARVGSLLAMVYEKPMRRRVGLRNVLVQSDGDRLVHRAGEAAVAFLEVPVSVVLDY
jgi:hypothetical protein